MKTIGMIGNGTMDRGIESNLLKHGHMPDGTMEPWQQATVGSTGRKLTHLQHAQETCFASGVTILCVTGTSLVEAVFLGDDGILKDMRPVTIVIDCYTPAPVFTKKNRSHSDRPGCDLQ